MAGRNMKWITSIRDKKMLELYLVDTGTWTSAITKAVKSFNDGSFGVRVQKAKKQSDANIAIVVADGKTSYTWQGLTFTTDGFKEGSVHGTSAPATEEGGTEILFSCIFLPGTNKKLTDGQKQVIALHEIIHSVGMREHDLEGVMCSPMTLDRGGLIETLKPSQNVKPMPPIRISSKTLSTVRSLWGADNAKKT